MKKIKSSETKKRRIKYFKILIGIFIGVMILNVSNYANAGINDTVIDKNRMDGVYAITKIGGVDRIFHLNMYRMNGVVAYCIDIGVDITTNIYNSTGDFGISYLTREQIDYIRSISYVGYGYPGHDDYRFYMAAQEIIWEYLSGVEVYWSNEMSANGKEIDINNFKAEIIRMRDEYARGLNIKLERGEYYIGEEVSVSVVSGNIENYTVSSDNNSSVSVNGNGLVIKMGNDIGKGKVTLNKRGIYNYDSQLYYYNTSQRLISNGNYNNDSIELSFNIKGVSLNVEVIDNRTGSNRPYSSKASLEGSIYEIRDSNDKLVGTYETNSEGKFNVNDLVFGKYYIKLIKPGRGYEHDDEVKEFTIDSYTNKLVLEQKLISNVFKINKVYGGNGDYKPEAGIKFRISNPDEHFDQAVVTDKKGSALIRLLYGSYTVSQENTVSGYSKVDNFKLEVLEESHDFININLVNEQILVKLKVVTYEKNKDKPFNMEGFAYKVKRDSDNTYIESNGEDIFYTNNRGELLIPVNLGYGTYYLEQVDSPNGVILNKEKYEIKIDDNSTLNLVDNNLVMEVLFYNELPHGRLVINTLEEIFNNSKNEFNYKTKPRSNSEVGLYSDDDIISNGELIFRKGSEVFNGKTDDNGKLVIDNLYLGKYCLIDKETMEKKCFELSSNNNYDKVIEEDVKFTKLLEKSNIIISNIDEQDKPIGGSIFEVIDKEGEVIYIGETNDDGIIKVSNLANGDYCIRQKKIRGDYELINEDKCILLNEDSNIKFLNKAMTMRTVVPNTWSNAGGNNIFYLLFLSSVVVGVGILVYKKIFASKLYR